MDLDNFFMYFAWALALALSLLRLLMCSRWFCKITLRRHSGSSSPGPTTRDSSLSDEIVDRSDRKVPRGTDPHRRPGSSLTTDMTGSDGTVTTADGPPSSSGDVV